MLLRGIGGTRLVAGVGEVPGQIFGLGFWVSVSVKVRCVQTQQRAGLVGTKL